MPDKAGECCRVDPEHVPTMTDAVPSTHGDKLARAALTVLVVLTVASPWPFGSVSSSAMRMVTLGLVATSLALTTAAAVRGWDLRVPIPIWAAVALPALATLQLVPLPRALHFLLAPGSAAVWHPTEPAAVAVLGPGPHPISIWPEATVQSMALNAGLGLLTLLAAPAMRLRRLALGATVVVVSGGFLVAAYGVVARLLFADRLYGVLPVPTVAPFGPFVSKNHFAGYVEMGALLALGLAVGLANEARRGPSFLSWIESRKAGVVVAAFGAFAAMSLSVLVSLSRGGFVSLSAGTLIFVFLQRRRSKGFLLAVLAAALAALALLPPTARERILGLAGATHDRAGAFRVSLWLDTLRLCASSPLLGQGFGSFADALPRFKRSSGDLRIEHAENDYLELLAEGGIVGFVIVGVLMAQLARVAEIRSRNQDERVLGSLGRGAIAALGAMAVHSLFDFNLSIVSNKLLTAYAAALALGGTKEDAWPRLGRGAAAALSIAVTLALATLPRPVLTGGVAGRPEIRALLDRGQALRLRSVEQTLVWHLGRRPADAEAWVRLGWIRSVQGSGDGRTLARHGASLDPLREALRILEVPT